VKVYLWAYLMKSNFERTWWRLSLSVPDEEYLWAYLMKIIFERTWWRVSLNVPD
jgi:hypothetical protein